ncbi:hypothetical protein SAMN02745126_02907 [Enhydrobacter aerosaccus]|uniref:Uncharacterized protein n=1 Tax=Enhydrobacter aerosaccus TaxID=225324 RepID=A0A1T4PP91_9HYPH|nr:hypothetical protein [Enhydrobacter aerosaccus]SJZ92708.1 hypothetical protein SAMN02745126_02907 [Enhydrobacter aerosaccus]
MPHPKPAISSEQPAIGAPDISALILAVLKITYDATRSRAASSCVPAESPGLEDYSSGQIDSAVLLSHTLGWLAVGNASPSSVAITFRGIDVLKKRGLA